jgi:hypothetical protein
VTSEESLEKLLDFMEILRLPVAFDAPMVDYWCDFGGSRPDYEDGLADAKLADVGGFASHKQIAIRSSGKEEAWPAHWPGIAMVSKMRLASPREARGKSARIFPQMMYCGSGDVFPDGSFRIAGEGFFGRFASHQEWRDCLSSKPVPGWFEMHLAGSYLVSRYQWEVRIGLDGRSRLAFPTCPVGAREAFALRDIPAGQKRRSALRNWIRAHSRKRVDGGSSSVSAHLRGATRFTWNGLDCEILPSRFDREKEALRKAGAK